MSKRESKPSAKSTQPPKSRAAGRPRASSPRKMAYGPSGPVKSAAGVQPEAENEASRLIDERIATLGDWRGETLAEVRRLIHEAEPDITEEWKWRGTPVWSLGGIVCTGETYKQVVKLTFARGASLNDPARLFNSSLDGNTRRAIDIRQGESLEPGAFKALIHAAVAENHRTGSAKAKSPTRSSARAAKRPQVPADQNVVLLSGGNPQIAKGDGDAPVQAYLAAIPGWKRDIGYRLDALIVRIVPHVRKAVKWNSPFYGVEGQGWFLSFHCYTRYIKVTFFQGTSLRPSPSGGTSKDARWIDVFEDTLDEDQMAAWVKQAAAIPGWMA